MKPFQRSYFAKPFHAAVAHSVVPLIEHTI